MREAQTACSLAETTQFRGHVRFCVRGGRRQAFAIAAVPVFYCRELTVATENRSPIVATPGDYWEFLKVAAHAWCLASRFVILDAGGGRYQIFTQTILGRDHLARLVCLACRRAPATADGHGERAGFVENDLKQHQQCQQPGVVAHRRLDACQRQRDADGSDRPRQAAGQRVLLSF